MNAVIYLCENPLQARTLARVLGVSRKDSGAYVGENVIVTYCFGHMLNLAPPEAYIGHAKWDVSNLPIVPLDWKWTVNSKHQEQFDNIGRWLQMADSVVIATDPDEEGEVIGRQVLRAHKYSGPVQRLWASALDNGSLKKALNNLLPLENTDSIYRAGVMRRYLDWMFGMNLTRAYSVILGTTACVGRVKSRLLKEICEREREIKNFVTTYYDEAYAEIDGFNFKWEADSAIAPFYEKQAQGVCVSSEEDVYVLPPPLPFTLSALLIHANRTAGIGLAAGYAAAQSLYLAGAISYPRTSSTILPGARGAGFAAHHAIIAIGHSCPSWLGEDANTIYDIVYLNGVHQQLGGARISRQTTEFSFSGERFLNVTEMTSEDDAGWLIIERKRLNVLTSARRPVFSVGQRVKVEPVVSTRPYLVPAHYTEASLLEMMVAKDIGTEATRVDSIASLERDKVAVIDRGVFRSTKSGRTLSEKLLPRNIEDMNTMVRKSVEHVKRHDGNGSSQIMYASKWLARVIQTSTPRSTDSVPSLNRT